MKKLIVMLMIACMVLCGANAVFAQNIDDMSEEELMQALANEPPLTQQDIDNFVKFFPEIEKASDEDDAAAMATITQATGWSEIRTATIMLRIALGWASINDPDNAMIFLALFPEEMLPSQAEIELINKNNAKLTPLFEDGE